MTISSPEIDIIRPGADTAVVADGVGMTYSVRANDEPPVKTTFLDRFRRASGMNEVKVEALKPVTFVAERGESIGVIGTNGSGKSTLMKLLTGQIIPTAGNVYAKSTPVMLGVNAALVGALTGGDNITLGCLAMGMSRAEVEAKRQSIIDLSGLKDSLHLPLRSYSSGMAARLQFAIAASVDPEILIIDEALNTGDAQFRDRTRARLDEVRENAGCVFLVSHSLGTIQQMCTRAIWIEKGEMMMDSDPKTVCEKYQEYANHLGRNRVKGARLLREEVLSSRRVTEIEWTGQPPRRSA